MPEVISCPSCQRKLQVPESLLGQDVQCPSCSSTFVATAGGATSAPVQAYAPTPQSGYDVQDPPARGPEPRYDDYEDRPARRRRRDFEPHRGGMILAFGIIGLVVCAIFSPIAWVMGNNDMQAIRAGQMDPEGEGLTQAGRILGMIGSIFLILGLVLGCIYFFVIMAIIGAEAGGRGF